MKTIKKYKKHQVDLQKIRYDKKMTDTKRICSAYTFLENLRRAGGQFPGANAQNNLIWPNSSSGAHFLATLIFPGA